MTEPRYPQVSIDVPLDEADEAAALLFDLGATGVEQRDDATLARGTTPGSATLVASFDDDAGAAAAAAALDPKWSPRVGEMVGDAWRDEWKKHYVPFRLTERVTIRPPWEAYQPKVPDEIVLELEPGRAFGTGLHATTALVARALDEMGGALRGARVLDVGAGSGILSLVALALGAARVRAVDIDADAVAVAVENAQRNGFDDRMHADDARIDDALGEYDVVVANIEARVLIEMAPQLVRRVRAGGVLVLSGILRGQENEVANAYAELAVRRSTEEGEWVVIVLDRAIVTNL